MSSIFEKNITALEIKNPVLAQKLQNYIPTEVPQLLKNEQFYNLLYKNEIIHNPKNPILEAHEIFARVINTPVAIHLIYGLGLGYLFQVASLKSQGTVILYEPDLNLLKTSFSLVDFSNDISKKNIYICDNYEDLTNEIYKHSDTQNSPQLLTLNSQLELEKENFDKLVQDLQNLIGMFALNLRYTKEKFYPSLKTLIENIPKLINDEPLINLKDCYSGKTAIIVSAGPTLDKNIEVMKNNRDKFILFSVGTALKTLVKHEIMPDFVSSIETYDNSKQFEGIDLSNINFITEPYSNPNLRRFNYKKTYIHATSNNPINEIWSKIFEANTQEYLSKGTVSYTLLNSARLLGFSKIILVGQDLAYIEGQCYSKDSAYKDLICNYNKDNQKWEIVAKDFEQFANELSNSPDIEVRKETAKRRLRNLNASLHYVKGINGDMIPTESVYATFIYPLSEYTKLFPQPRYINTSLIGAQIDGFENISLDEALKDSDKLENIELHSTYSINKENCLKNLDKLSEELRIASVMLSEGNSYIKSLRNSLKRHNDITKDILQSLKKLSLHYVSLSTDYANKSKIFELITTAEKIDLDYEMKMITDFNHNNVLSLCNKISDYYENAKNRINELYSLIKDIINKDS